MTSKEFTWNQLNSHGIKKIHMKRIQMKSNRFKWNQKILNEINAEFTRTQMNSNEICKKYRKMWISEKNILKRN